MPPPQLPSHLKAPEAHTGASWEPWALLKWMKPCPRAERSTVFIQYSSSRWQEYKYSDGGEGVCVWWCGVGGLKTVNSQRWLLSSQRCHTVFSGAFTT